YTHSVCAGRYAVDAIDAPVVRFVHERVDVGQREPSFLLLSNRVQLKVFGYNGRTVCVRDPSRDNAAAHEREVDLIDRLALSYRHELARPSVESVARPYHCRGKDGDRVATRRNICQPVVA